MTDQPGWARPGEGDQPRPQAPPGWGPQQPPYVPPPGWAPQQPPPYVPPPGAAPGWSPPQQGWGGQPGWPTAGKPGVIPLRPLGVGEILDGAISTLRAHPKVMLGVSALIAVATQLLLVPVTWLLLHDAGDTAFRLDQPASQDEEFAFAASSLTAAGLQIVVTLVASLVLTGIVTVVVSRAVLGQDVSPVDAWEAARPRLPALFGVTLVVFLVIVAVLVATVGPGVLLALGGAPVGAVAAAFVLGVPAAAAVSCYLYVAFALAPASVVLERQPVVASLRRSRFLVTGAWWRTFGILLLVNVIAQILSGILSTVFTVLAFGVAFVAGDGSSVNLYEILPLTISSIGTIIAATVTWPFTAAATALLYVDRRIRREALDMELARAAGLTVPGQSATPGQPYPAPGTGQPGAPGDGWYRG